MISNNVFYIKVHFSNADFCQAAVAIRISKFLNCFCSFGLSCPILEKDNFI